MIFVLYAATAALILLLCHRYVRPLTRAAAIVLFLLPMLFTGRALLTGGVYAPIDLPYQSPPLSELKEQYGIGDPRNVVLTDLYAQIIPWRQALRWSVAQGKWPLWNPFILCGDILAAAAQPAAYSPFTLLALLLPVAQSFTFTAAIMFLVAGVGAFAFVRQHGCREIASLIAAAGWMYATSISFFILWPIGAAWLLLPLVLTGVAQLAESPTLRSAAVLTASFVLLLLAGHPETAFHVTFLGLVYGVFCLAQRRETWPRAAGYALGSGVVALLLCAIYLLPLLEAVEQTSEHAYRRNMWAVEPRGVHWEQSVARLAADFFPFLHLRRWSMQHAHAVKAETFSIGSLLLGAAIFAIWRVRSRTTWFFTAMLLFCIAARAEPWWFERPLQKLPLFDIALNSRLSFGAAFSLVVLAALGLEAADRWLTATNLALLGALGFGTWCLSRSDLIATAQLPWGHHKIAAELVLLAVAALLIRSPRALPLFFVLLLVQRFVEEGRAYPTLDARAAYPPIPLLADIPRGGEPFRVAGIGNALPPGTSAMYELEDARGYQAMTLQRLIETYPLWSTHQPVWFNRVDGVTPFLSFLNVRWLIAPDGRVIENEQAFPRAFVPHRVRLGISDPIAEMTQETDFRENAWIEASTEAHFRDNGPGTVAIESDGVDLRLEVDMERPGWVVISQSAWKGWRAYLDGQRVGMQIANVAFLSVYVPQGKHEVRLTYLPQTFVTGRTISALTLLGIVVGLGWRRRGETRLKPGAT